MRRPGSSYLTRAPSMRSSVGRNRIGSSLTAVRGSAQRRPTIPSFGRTTTPSRSPRIFELGAPGAEFLNMGRGGGDAHTLYLLPSTAGKFSRRHTSASLGCFGRGRTSRRSARSLWKIRPGALEDGRRHYHDLSRNRVGLEDYVARLMAAETSFCNFRLGVSACRRCSRGSSTA